MVDDNFVFDNLLAGISLDVGGGANDEFDVSVSDNQIKDNGGSGIVLNSAGDAVLRVNIVGNAIVDNAVDGIIALNNQQGGDTGTIRGEISDNLIEGNAIHGIDLQTTTGDPTLAVSEGLTPADRAIAEDENELFVRRNTIRNNGQIGVLLLGNGSATFEENLITRNGPAGGSTGGAGIDIVSGAFSTGSTYFGLNFNDDVVSDNRGDGIELLFNGLAGPPSGIAGIFDHYVRFRGVEVRGNDGRGYDALNRGSLKTTLEITGRPGEEAGAGNSFISGNGREGVYIVNTASPNQTQDLTVVDIDEAVLPVFGTPVPSGLQPFGPPLANPAHGLFSDGQIENIPVLNLLFERNLVAGNGAVSNFDANGLVIRVGTSGSPLSSPVDPFLEGQPGADGGFASLNVYDLAMGQSGDLYIDDVVRDRSGVVAIVQDNEMRGNVGTDFLFEGFVSTVDPATSEFEGDPFDVDLYQQDPKARLDLVFGGNSFFNSGLGTLDGARTAGAYYDNEDEFKSQSVAEDGELNDPPGPFPPNTPETRRRNAQRQDVPGLGGFAPGFGTNNTLFPAVGVGESTFRVNANGVNTVFSPGNPGGQQVDNFTLFGPIFVPLNEPAVGNDDFIWNLE